MNFKQWLETDDYWARQAASSQVNKGRGPEFGKIFQLRFGESGVVVTQVANKIAQQFNQTIPTELGQMVVIRPADNNRGSLVMKNLGSGKFQCTHKNDPIDPTRARTDIPYGYPN